MLYPYVPRIAGPRRAERAKTGAPTAHACAVGWKTGAPTAHHGARLRRGVEETLAASRGLCRDITPRLRSGLVRSAVAQANAVPFDGTAR